VDRDRELADRDPAVAAGRYRHELHTWTLPSGLITFTKGHMPGSLTEAMS
jgi:hypothetical protein